MADIIDAGVTYVKEKLKNGLIRARFFLPAPPSWKYIDGKWIGGESYRAVVDKLKVNIVYKGSPDWQKKTNVIHQDKRVVADKYFLNKTAYFSPRLYLDGKEILPESDWKIGESPNRLEMDYGICKHILQLRHGEILDWWVFEKNPEGDILIKSNLQKDDDIKTKKPFAISELGRIDIETKSGNKYIPKKVFDNVAYPFWVDDTVNFYSTSSDGRIYTYLSGYTSARDATTGTVEDTTVEFVIGQWYDSNNNKFNINRGFLFFDTSSIPSNTIITSANLHLYLHTDNSITDFDIVIQNGQPTYPHDPLESGDYDRTHYSGNGGTLNTSSLSSGYNTITLNSDGRSWIQKGSGAKTKLCLRSSRDINGNAPSGKEYAHFYLNEKGSGYQPYLEVTYSIVTTYTKTFTTDADIKGISNKTLTTDSNIVDRIQKTLTTDGAIKGILTHNLTTDADILEPIYISLFFNKVSLYKAIQTIADICLANFKIDENGDFWFYPKTDTNDTGITIDENNYISASNLTDTDFSQVYNAVLLVGGKVLAYREDEFTGDGSTKTFKLSRKVARSLLVTVDDIPQVGGINGTDSCSDVDYLYDAEKNEITFCTAPEDSKQIVVSYYFFTTLRYYATDDESIELYGKREHEPIIDEQITKYEMLVYKGAWFLSNYSLPKLQGSITVDMDLIGTVLHAGDTVTINLPRYRINNETVRIEKITYNITPTRTTATITFVRRKDLGEFLGRVFDKIEQIRQAMETSENLVIESDLTLSDSVSVIDSKTISSETPKYYWGDTYIDRNIVEDDDVYG